MEGKIIKCCGDCVHYDWKKHRCKCGNSEEGTAQQHFYQDCKIFEDLEEHDKQIREELIEDIKKYVRLHLKYAEHTIDDFIFAHPFYDWLDTKK